MPHGDTGCGLPWPALAFATAVRVVDRVHGRRRGRSGLTPRQRLAPALPSLLEVVLDVADFTDGGAAVGRHLAHFAGAQAQRGVAAVAGDQLGPAPAERAICAPLPGFISMQCTVRADRHVAQRQRVADLDRRVRPDIELVADASCPWAR